MRITPRFVVAATLPLAAVAAIGQTRATPPPAAPIAPDAPRAEAIVDTGEFMDVFMEPVYDELKKAVNRRSHTRKEMAAVYNAAIRLAEISNLLFSRDPDRHTSEPDWPRLSAAFRDSATAVADATLVALRNARPQDFEPVRVRFRDVAEACNACHRGVKSDAKPIRP